jgi:hypothetical protein
MMALLSFTSERLFSLRTLGPRWNSLDDLSSCCLIQRSPSGLSVRNSQFRTNQPPLGHKIAPVR